MGRRGSDLRTHMNDVYTACTSLSSVRRYLRKYFVSKERDTPTSYLVRDVDTPGWWRSPDMEESVREKLVPTLDAVEEDRGEDWPISL